MNARKPERNLCQNTPAQTLTQGPAPVERCVSPPSVAATPSQLWRAFEAVEADQVKGSGGQQLADLVNLVRHALIPNFTLVPYRDELRDRYEAWLKESSTANSFTPEQREWLDRMAEHIATSLAIAPEDFEADMAASAAHMRCSATSSRRS